jgi:hypothetical protein
VRADLAYSESLSDIIKFLAAARGLTHFMRDDDRGFAVLYDFLQHGNSTLIDIPPGNLLIMGLAPSESHFLHENPHGDLHESALRESIEILDQLIHEAAARDNYFFPHKPLGSEARDHKLSQGLIENLLPPDKK